MKHFLFVLLLASVATAHAQLLMSNAAGISISNGTALTIKGSLENKNGASLTNQGSINLNGNWLNSATYSGTGSVEFNNGYTQTITSGASPFATLKVNKTAGFVTLLSGTQVNAALDLTGAGNFIKTGNYNLTLSSGAALTGASSSSYIITNGTGSLVLNQTGSATSSFPVGTSATDYTPAQITNAGTNDDFAVRVFDSVYTAYNGAGTATGVVLTPYQEVHKTWVINESIAGGSNAIVQLQWNVGAEGAVFARSNCAVSYYNGSAWVKNNSGGLAGGSNPYTRSNSAFTSFSNTPYGVGSSNSPLPVALTQFDAKRKAGDVLLTWTTANEHNSAYFNIERSLDASHWTEAGKVNAAGNSHQYVQYNFTDKSIFNTPEEIIVYYRLKMVDNSGDYSYSAIRVLNKSKNATTHGSVMNVYPNPCNGVIRFTVEDIGAGAWVQLFDVNGKLLISKALNPYQNTQSLDAGEYADGMYLLEVNTGTGRLHQKIQITR